MKIRTFVNVCVFSVVYNDSSTIFWLWIILLVCKWSHMLSNKVLSAYDRSTERLNLSYQYILIRSALKLDHKIWKYLKTALPSVKTNTKNRHRSQIQKRFSILNFPQSCYAIVIKKLVILFHLYNKVYMCMMSTESHYLGNIDHTDNKNVYSTL